MKLQIVTVYFVILLFPLFITDADACLSSRRRRRLSPPPDTTSPTFTSCAWNIGNWYTTSTSRTVTWSTPRATDDRGSASVSRVSGGSPGSYFHEGSHTVRYRATDSAGNYATCTITFVVVVIRCSSLSGPSHGSVGCSNVRYVGSTCRYSCSTGYYVSGGSSSRTCRRTGNSGVWSGSAPYCARVTCPSLSAPSNGRKSCTDGRYYNSRCTFSCNQGYTLEGSSSQWTCLSSGSWSNGGTSPTCADTTSPSFTHCPASQSVYAPALATKATVTWSSPTATDNSGETITPVRVQGSPSGSQFSEGVHHTQYRAADSAGNENTCSFSITVAVIQCPAQSVSTPLRVSCPDGNIRGSVCSFSCVVGYSLQGEGSTECQLQGSTGAWTHGHPSCQILQCPSISLQHGAVVGTCPRNYGTNCQFSCNTGYEINNDELTCNVQPGGSDAYWVGVTPECSRILCTKPHLSTALQMVVTSACPAGNVVPSGNQCRFSCSQGYYLQGITTVTCHHNRTWSGKLPSCHLITCSSEDIPAPDHGRKVGCSDDREDYGTSCTLACEDGYEPTTPISKTCSDDGDGDDEGVWTGSDIACTIVTCPALTPPANGAISQCSFMGVVEPTTSPSQNYSAVCTVACNTGFTMTEGSAQRTCLSTGSWETSPTTCSDITPPVITCPLDVELIAEAGISSATVHWANLSQPQATDRGTVIGTHAYSIDSVQVAGNTSSLPASLSEGDHTVVHRAVDSAGNSATCSQNIWVRVVRCPPLQIPDDGAATLTAGQGSCEGGVVYGSTCLIACDSGFQMYPGSGPTMERICDWSMLSGTTAGFWTEFNPACYPVNCTVPSVTNGQSSDCPSATTEFRTSCQFSCSAGYTSPSGVVAVSRTCQSDQSWSGDDFQCTEPKTCPGNFSISYGSVTPQECSGTDPVLFDTTCSFVCDDGFRLEGPGNIVCSTKGQWTHPSAPTCTDIQPPNFNSSCPSEIRIFAPMGTTSGIVNFQDPIASDNSGNVHVSKLNDHYRPGSLFPEGETVIGYLATDAAGMTTRCEIIITVEVHRCPIQQPLLHGSVVNCTDPLYGIRCSFSCDEGYDLIGPSAVSCDLSSDGSPAWEDAPPVCQIQTCPPLLPTNPATVVGCDPSSPVPYRSECTMQCPFGFVGVGEILKRCLADGVWSSTNFTCDRKACSPLVETDVISITPSTCLSDPRYQDTCHLECQRSGFQIFPSEYEETTCTGTQIWSRDITVAKCKDTQPPTFVQCPSEVVVYASRSSDTTLVSWNVTAMDNSDLEPTLSCDLQPGVMTRGIYQVSCSARDDAGNENDCIFGAEVKVRRCQRLVPPVHGTIEEACNDTFGGECTVSCSAGYKRIGSRRGSCEFNGTDTFWHFEQDPICEVMGCPPLPLNQSILVTPTDCAQANKVPLGTVCVLHCDPGFTLEGDGQPLTCLTSEEWSRPLDVESLLCADRTPPTNLSCPLAPIMAVRKEYSGVEVTFDLPSADDAVDGTNLQVTTEPPDLRTPYTFLADTLCRFTFTDSSNNSASCLFHVFVSNEVQPIFEECPPILNVTTVSQITSIPWEKPSYLAIPGLVLTMDCNMPNPVRLPWGEYQLVCQVIDPQSGLHAECSRNFFVKPISCTPLRTPAHGSLVCDTFFYGKSCSIMCQEEHDIARSREFKGNSLYICGNSGRWSPSTYVPDCSEKKKAERFNLPLEIMYYADSCQSAESNTLPALKEKFIDIIKASLFQEICTGNQKCRAENVKVECGQGNSRRRRDAPELAAGTVLYDEKNKTTLTATISMVLQGPSSDTPLTDEGDSPHHHHKNLERLAHDIYHRIKGVVFTGDEETNSRPTPSLHLGSASAKCEVGFVADDTSHMCVACPAGHYFRGNPSQGECLLCERGTYQDRQAQTECKPCGDGRGTIEEGARSFSQCVALCQQGSYSSSGLEPCVRCERGTYQPRSGQSSCLPCPAGLTTPTHSSVSIQSCQEPCPAGHTSSTGFQPCFPCPLGFYQPHQGRTACHKCGDSTTTQDVGSTSIMMCH